MSEPFVGEIMIFGGNFPPRGWATCEGQLLPISSNDALFSLLGTIYGGDGRTTFGLPDMRGRIALHMGTGPGLSPRSIGSRSGSETVTLTTNQLASHNHPLLGASTPATSASPVAAVPAETSRHGYAPGGATDAMATGALSNTGGSQSHTNMPPFLALYYCIALVGIYPSRN